MGKRDEEGKRDRLVAALKRIYQRFEFQSQSEMARATGMSQPTLNRAMDRSKLIRLSRENRRKVSRFLACQSESEADLEALVADVGWEMREADWHDAWAHLKRVRGELYDVPYLAMDRIVGQEREVDQLCAWLLDMNREAGRVMVVNGVGGVGKTVLVIRAVNDLGVRERYLGGIFWVDVERYGESEAIWHLARRVADRVTSQVEDPWRTVKKGLAGEPVVVVLDGVKGEIDLTRWSDLLPWRGRLLVTRRGQRVKTGRVGVREIALTGLSFEEARALLTRGLAVDVEDEDLAWLVEVVGGLPLALSIGNCAARFYGTVGGIIEDLRETGLDALAYGDNKDVNVRAAFDLSYRRLEEREQTLFRGLGVGLNWFEVGVVAAVMGWSTGAVRRGLRRLIVVGLVKNAGVGTYRMHNLVHRYAADLGQTDERWRSWQRQYAAYYLDVAREADRVGNAAAIGERLPEIFHGMVCAMTLEDREMVFAYARHTVAYTFHDEEAILDVWKAGRGEGVCAGERDQMLLRAARFCRGTGQFERALKRTREARSGMDASSVEPWVDTMVIEGEMLLALGRVEEAAEVLTDQAFWEQVARLDDNDDLLLQIWRLNERVGKELGEETGCEANAKRAQERWQAGQASPGVAKLCVLRSTPLSEDEEEASQALKQRMALAETVGDEAAWIADALQRGALLVRQGRINQAEGMLEEIDRRASEMADARYDPWVRVLEARVSWALGWEEDGDMAYREAVEALAGVFKETVFWPVDREGIAGETVSERAIEVWQRALSDDEAFRHVDTTYDMYTLFAWRRVARRPEKDYEEAWYRAKQTEMKSIGFDLPDLDWLEAGVNLDDSA